MTRQERIRRAVVKARTDWLEYTVRQERRLYDLCADAADRIQRRIDAATRAGKVPPQRLVFLLGKRRNPDPDSVRGILVRLRPQLTGQIRRGMSRSVDHGLKTHIAGLAGSSLPHTFKVGIGTSFIGADGKVYRYDAAKQLYKASTWARVHSDAMDHLMRTQYGGRTLSQRVWDITYQAEKGLRGRLTTGVMLGDGPERLGREARAYLVRPDARFHRVRKDGKLVLSKPARAYHPGRGVYRSAYQNARRLARTELGRAYHEGQVRYVSRKRWLDGVIWRVGGANPCPVCLDLNGRFFTAGKVPGVQHPNCMCWTEPHVKGDPRPERQPAMSRQTKRSVATAY